MLSLRLILMAGLVLVSSGGVLCLDDCGRAVIEAVCQPCCGDDQEICKIQVLNNDGDPHNSCSDCTDVPLLLSAVSNRPFLDILDSWIVGLDLSIPAPAATISDTRPTARAITAASKMPPGWETHSRTTVLRC